MGPEDATPVEGGRAPGDRNTAGDLAYVVATSGPTGTPKLVMIEHDSIVTPCRAGGGLGAGGHLVAHTSGELRIFAYIRVVCIVD